MMKLAWLLGLPLLLAGCGLTMGSHKERRHEASSKEAERTAGEAVPPADAKEPPAEAKQPSDTGKKPAPAAEKAPPPRPVFPDQSAEEAGFSLGGDFFKGDFHPGFDPYRSPDATNVRPSYSFGFETKPAPRPQEQGVPVQEDEDGK